MTRPELGRSRPASTMRSVDLPEPEGPTRPAVSPLAIRRSMPLRILTGPAVLGRLSFTLSSSMIASVKKSPSLWSCLDRLVRQADGTLGLGSGNENDGADLAPATLDPTLETKSELPHAIWPRGFALQVLLQRGTSLYRRPHHTLFRGRAKRRSG